MSISANQQRTFLRLLQPLRARWRTDQALPRTIQSLLSGERAFGSRDRRLYRELIYTTLRYLPWVEPLLDTEPDEASRRVAWWAADIPATKAFRATFATGQPPTGDQTEASLPPATKQSCCPGGFASIARKFSSRRNSKHNSGVRRCGCDCRRTMSITCSPSSIRAVGPGDARRFFRKRSSFSPTPT
jgi:hypothetical protein